MFRESRRNGKLDWVSEHAFPEDFFFLIKNLTLVKVYGCQEHFYRGWMEGYCFLHTYCMLLLYAAL